ncbi:MAG: single-stranded DNA-binding protein [Clostridiales bacterium]|nr:single-stranded DNA-binding protein [Clostridiales bacterium]
MQQDIRATNRIAVTGRIEGEFSFSHRVYGEGFYSFFIRVPRLSEVCDLLPVTISERLIDENTMHPGAEITIKGQLRSYNTYSENRNHLILSIFTKDVAYPDELSRNEPPNSVCLNGFICKPPLYRTTPLGREIADILLAVNRTYGKSDYIPLIAWGRNALFSKNLAVGSNILIEGRMQSRLYQKKFDNGETAEKTAYEVSVSKMELLEKDF